MTALTHPLFLGGALVSFLWGLAWLPTLCWALYPMVPTFASEAIGRILWIFAQINYGGSVLLYHEDGSYGIYPLTETEDGGIAYVADGEMYELDGDRDAIERFGFRPFAMAAEKTLTQVEPYLADERELPDGQADGGVSMLDEVRCGYQSFYRDIGPDKWRVDMAKVLNEVYEAASGETVQRAEEAELIDSGGAGQLGLVATVVGVFLCLLLGSTMSLFLLGVIP